MRQIEKNMLAAIKQGRNWKKDNTKVVFAEQNCAVLLHDNTIYLNIKGVREFSLCGWNTPTTRSRLRALGIDIRVKNGVPYYQGQAISSREYYYVK